MNWFNSFSAFIYSSLVLTFRINGVSVQNIHSVNITRADNFDLGDEVNLVVVNTSLCQEQNAINAELSASCTLLAQRTVEFGDNSCYIECVCNNETGSFILHEQKCGDERKLREGCSFVFGSWSWSEGWRFNSETDRLFTLYIEDGFGLQGAFNVSADVYDECTYTSLSTYDAAGMWNAFTAMANESSITFFGLRGYWHFNWIIENLPESKKSEIEGKFIKLDVTCQNSNEANGIVEVTQLSSCLVFKVTGNVSHEYNLISTSTVNVVHPSTTMIQPITTTDIPIQSTSEHMKSSATIQEPTSSLVTLYTTTMSSQSNLVIASSSVINPAIASSSAIESSLFFESSSVFESSSIIESNSVIEHSPVLQSSSVIESSPVVASSSVIESSPVVASSSVIESTPRLVIQSSSVIERNSVLESSSLIDINPVFTSSSVTNVNPVTTHSSVINSMAQSTQASQPQNDENQIGLILGIVVASSAAVVIVIATMVITATTVYHNHVKRALIIHNDARNIRLNSFDNISPTHI